MEETIVDFNPLYCNRLVLLNHIFFSSWHEFLQQYLTLSLFSSAATS